MQKNVSPQSPLPRKRGPPIQSENDSLRNTTVRDIAAAVIIKLKDRYEKIGDQAIAALHRSGDWAMPTRSDRLLMFGALNWSAQWYKPGAGGTR